MMASAVASPPYFIETTPNTIVLDVSPVFHDRQKMANCFRADIGHDMGDQFTDNLREDFKKHVSNFSDSVGKDMVLRYVGIQYNDLHKSAPKVDVTALVGTPDMDDGKKALRTILKTMNGPLLGTYFRNNASWSPEQCQVFAKHILALITAIHLDGDGNSINEILDIFFDADEITMADIYAFCKSQFPKGISLTFNVYYEETNPIMVTRLVGFPDGSTIPSVITQVSYSGKPLFQTPPVSLDSADTRFVSSVTTLTTIARTYYMTYDISNTTKSPPSIEKVVKDNYVKRAGKTLGKVTPGILVYISETVRDAGFSRMSSPVDVLRGCCAIKTSCDSTKALLTESLTRILHVFEKTHATAFFTGDILAFAIFGYTLGGTPPSTTVSSYDPRTGTKGSLESFTLSSRGGQVVFNSSTLNTLGGGSGFTYDIPSIVEQGVGFGFTPEIVNRLVNNNGGASSGVGGGGDVGMNDGQESRRSLFSILKQIRLENRGNPIYKDGVANKIFFAWIIQLLNQGEIKDLQGLFGVDYLSKIEQLMDFPFKLGDKFRSFADVPTGIARKKVAETILFTIFLGGFQFHTIIPPNDDTQKNTLDYITTLIYVYLYRLFFEITGKTISERITKANELFTSFTSIYGNYPILWKITLLSPEKYNLFFTTIGSGLSPIVSVPGKNSKRIASVTTPLLSPPTLTSKGISDLSSYASTGSAQGNLLWEAFGRKDTTTIYSFIDSIFKTNQLVTLTMV